MSKMFSVLWQTSAKIPGEDAAQPPPPQPLSTTRTSKVRASLKATIEGAHALAVFP